MTRIQTHRILFTRLTLASVAVVFFFAPSAHAAAEFPLLPDPLLLGVLVVAFFLFILPLNKVLFAPLLNALEEREKSIQGARNRAEEVTAQAQEILQRYDTEIRGSRERADQSHKAALGEARSELAQITGEARSFAEEELERARGEVGNALVNARAELRTHADGLAQEAASKILGRTLS